MDINSTNSIDDGGSNSSPSSTSSSPLPDSAISIEERKKKASLRLDALLELFVSEREYVNDLEAAISVCVATHTHARTHTYTRVVVL
jgi:hypothetical protein